MKKLKIIVLIIFLVTLSSCKEDIATTKKIIFETNGGDALSSISYELDSFPVEIPTPTKEGYNFLGWFIDNGKYDIAFETMDKTTITTDITLYAKWDNPRILILMEDSREIRVELYPDIAPISVDNFLNLVEEEYYTDVIFHRIIRDFMIQTGGYFFDGVYIQPKEHKDAIKGEFINNGVENSLSHEVGVISMARSAEYDSASTQFFIVSATSPHLDGDYAAFGKVLDQDSLEVVLSLSYTPTFVIGGMANFPLEDGENLLIIHSITLIE